VRMDLLEPTSTCTSRGCCKIDQLRRSLSVEMRVMSVCVFCLSARQGIPDRGVRLVSLGQTDGQLATAELEGSVLTASAQAKNATIDDLATATFMVDLVSMARETQYKRLFRS
jgi:urease accessory protein UreF